MREKKTCLNCLWNVALKKSLLNWQYKILSNKYSKEDSSRSLYSEMEDNDMVCSTKQI